MVTCDVMWKFQNTDLQQLTITVSVRRGILKNLFVILGALIIGACAGTPDVTVTYYPVKTNISFKVTRTILCDEYSEPVIANTVEPLVTHSADIEKTPIPIEINKFEGTLSNSDVAFGFYPDGRLKSINATSVGQGAAILKSASTLISSVVGYNKTKPPVTPECKYIKASGVGKPIALTFSGEVVNLALNDATPITVDQGSETYFKKIDSLLKHVCAVVKKTPGPIIRTRWNKGNTNNSNHDSKFVKLQLIQPALVEMSLIVGNDVSCSSFDSSPDVLWTGTIPVAQNGSSFELPIPKSKTFWKASLCSHIG